ncbi:MAG: hypothetical protein AB7P03_09760 [Kofleriaceae bacterium]
MWSITTPGLVALATALLCATARANPRVAAAPPCERVAGAIVEPHDDASTCGVKLAIDEDNRGAGFDIPVGQRPRYVDRIAVSGCVQVRFGAHAIDRLELTARPVANACAKVNTPCEPGYCGSGAEFYVFTAAHPKFGRSIAWRRAGVVRITAPRWAEYRLALPDASPLVMVCRGESAARRDDLLLDAVFGCAHGGP